ncbi:hypothetical protein BC830DRAFT_1080631 [Chytriomyces sp. MP71]|nr:hypothetical protein BC830DRAFT_1080631 [Chytriomyces sp. MP71]
MPRKKRETRRRRKKGFGLRRGRNEDEEEEEEEEDDKPERTSWLKVATAKLPTALQLPLPPPPSLPVAANPLPSTDVSLELNDTRNFIQQLLAEKIAPPKQNLPPPPPPDIAIQSPPILKHFQQASSKSPVNSADSISEHFDESSNHSLALALSRSNSRASSDASHKANPNALDYESSFFSDAPPAASEMLNKSANLTIPLEADAETDAYSFDFDDNEDRSNVPNPNLTDMPENEADAYSSEFDNHQDQVTSVVSQVTAPSSPPQNSVSSPSQKDQDSFFFSSPSQDHSNSHSNGPQQSRGILEDVIEPIAAGAAVAAVAIAVNLLSHESSPLASTPPFSPPKPHKPSLAQSVLGAFKHGVEDAASIVTYAVDGLLHGDANADGDVPVHHDMTSSMETGGHSNPALEKVDGGMMVPFRSKSESESMDVAGSLQSSPIQDSSFCNSSPTKSLQDEGEESKVSIPLVDAALLGLIEPPAPDVAVCSLSESQAPVTTNRDEGEKLSLSNNLTTTVVAVGAIAATAPASSSTTQQTTSPKVDFQGNAYETFSDFLMSSNKPSPSPTPPLRLSSTTAAKPPTSPTKKTQSKPPSKHPSVSQIPRPSTASSMAPLTTPASKPPFKHPGATASAKKAALDRANSKLSALHRLAQPKRASSASPTRKPAAGVPAAKPPPTVRTPSPRVSTGVARVPDTPDLLADVDRILSAKRDDGMPSLPPLPLADGSGLREEIERLQARLGDVEAENVRLKEEVAFLEHLREAEAKVAPPAAIVGDLASKEDVERVRKEIVEQENLIKGYQHENEKLTDQLKTLKKQHKESESRAFLRIETLQREIQALKALPAAGSGAEGFDKVKLAARVDELQEKLVAQDRDFAEERESLQGEVAKLRAQLAEALATLSGLEGCSREEVDSMREGFEAERGRLEAFITGLEVWLEREVALKEMLMEQREYEVQHGIGVVEDKKSSGKGSGVFRGAEGRRIKELESLVAKLQDKVARKALWLQENMSELLLKNKPGMEEATYIRHLKEHVKRLQGELETKETAWKVRLEALQKETAASKARYETKMTELQIRIEETQNASAQAIATATNVSIRRQQSGASSSPTAGSASQLKDLEKQLESLLLRYHEKLTEATETEMSDHLATAEASIGKAFKIREAKLRTRIVELENVIDSQAATLESMRADRAAAEREAALRVQMRDALVTSYENKITSMRREFHDRVFGAEEQKLLSEIHRLRMEVEALRGEKSDVTNRLEISEATRKSVHETTVAILRQAQEESAKIALAHHERALSMLRDETKTATAALIDAEVRRLQKALADAEVEVTRWQQRCASLEREKHEWRSAKHTTEEVMTMRENIEGLQESVKELQILNADLQRQLAYAKSSWPPDRRRFNELEVMLDEMETGFRKREAELQHLIALTKRDADGEVERVKSKYIPLLERRDREILYFRDEVDKLVEALRVMGENRHLQRRV